MNGKTLLIFLSIIISNILLPQNNVSDIDQARKYFHEAQLLSVKDNGSTWGKQLYGPMLFVNPATRFVIANEPDKENSLEKKGEVYCGSLPKEINIANTAFDWNGKKWTMVILPLPENKLERTSLMMHELFHRIQGEINLIQHNTVCNHLNQKDGRILLRLELRELLSALKTESQERSAHLKNAVTLNKYRAMIYAGADSLESCMELNEGLAEYTGLKLCGEPMDSIIAYETNRINMIYTIPSFVRSFAYFSGPLYCFLLDNSGIQWRNRLEGKTKLIDLVANAYSIKPGNDLAKEAQAIINDRKNSEIVEFENEREVKRQEQLRRLKDKFVNKPVIIIQLQNMNIQFDPRTLIPIDSAGTVYPNLRVTDDWGILDVMNEALLSSDWRSIRISLPENYVFRPDVLNIKCNDWELNLKQGWKLKPTQTGSSYILYKEN